MSVLQAEVWYYPDTVVVAVAVVFFIVKDPEKWYFIAIHKPVFWFAAIRSYTDHVREAKNEIKIKFQINGNSKEQSHRKCYWTGY